ncbi:MAG: FliM/FliN family flagellar motor switch protein [Myxococcota bacterium]
MATLLPEELDSLMSALGKNTGRSEVVYSPLDLTNPERNVPEPMPKLEAICRGIGNKLAILLSSVTSKSIEPRFSSITRARFKDLLAENNDGVVGVVELQAADKPGLALVPATLAAELLLATVGAKGDGSPAFDPSAPSLLELAVLKRLLASLERAIDLSFAGVISLSPRLTDVTTDPRLAGRFTDEDVAIVASFSLAGDIEGDLRLALPFVVLEQAREDLIVPRRRSMKTARWRELAEEVEGVELDLVVELGRGQLTYLEGERLAEGDVLLLDSLEGGPLIATLAGEKKLEVRPEVRGSRIVAVIERVIAKTQDPATARKEPLLNRALPPPRQHQLVGTGLAKDKRAVRTRVPVAANKANDGSP